MKNITKILWGIVLIALGLIIAVNSLGIAKIDIFFEGWWTLFIIVPSIIGLIDGKDKSGSLIFLAIGIFLLLGARDLISYKLILQLIVPFILIVIGISIIFEEIFGSSVKEKVKTAKPEDLENVVAILNEEIRSIDTEFKGSTVDAVFGHAVLDIRKSKFDTETTIKASAIFGGIDILVPEGVKVKVKSTKILGGVEKKNIEESSKKKEKTIYIDAFVLFGGIEIK